MENITTYRSDFNRYFVDYNGIEGEIKLGTGNHGGESYKYISHIEWDGDISDDESEAVEKYLDDNLVSLVFNAEKI